MKIVDIKTIPVRIPSRTFNTALGPMSGFDYVIVLMETDAGITGLGEVSTLWDGRGPVQRAFIVEQFRPLLIGEDPTAVNRCLGLMEMLSERAWPARAAVEMALFDIVGKALDTPVFQLLGGRYRASIPLSRSVYMGTPDEMAGSAVALVSEGYRCLKVKVGVNIDADIAGVSAIRKAIGPAVALRLDANMGWRTAKEAIRAMRRLADFDIHSIEQPIPPGNLNALKRVRDAIDVPVMVDESVWGPSDARDILRADAADMLNIYVSESGGMTNGALIARMADLEDVPVFIGAMPELGIGTSAAIHLGISMRNLGDYTDACGSLYQLQDIIVERFIVQDGAIQPLPGPGLGVTLDLAVLEQVRTDR